MEPIELGKIIAIFLLQLIGVGLAFCSVWHMGSYSNIDPGLKKRMLWATGIILPLTVLVFMIHKNIWSCLWSITPIQNPWQSITINCNYALIIYGLTDLFALWVLIYATGGPRHSIYLPYLLIVVPLIIMLKASFMLIIICFVLTLIIFVCSFHWRYADFTITTEYGHRICDRYFACITILCVLFPMGIQLCGYCIAPH